jgi:hypothetical protein
VASSSGVLWEFYSTFNGPASASTVLTDNVYDGNYFVSNANEIRTGRITANPGGSITVGSTGTAPAYYYTAAVEVLASGGPVLTVEPVRSPAAWGTIFTTAATSYTQPINIPGPGLVVVVPIMNSATSVYPTVSVTVGGNSATLILDGKRDNTQGPQFWGYWAPSALGAVDAVITLATSATLTRNLLVYFFPEDDVVDGSSSITSCFGVTKLANGASGVNLTQTVTGVSAGSAILCACDEQVAFERVLAASSVGNMVDFSTSDSIAYCQRRVTTAGSYAIGLTRTTTGVGAFAALEVKHNPKGVAFFSASPSI